MGGQFVIRAALGLIIICANVLRPTPDAERIVPGTASAAGVTVSVDPNAWHGSEQIKNDVTPLRVKIENDSGRKLRIRFDNFSVLSETGDHYAALPPFYVSGNVTDPEFARRYFPVRQLKFTYRGFNVGPKYHFYYPGLSVVTVPQFHVDRRYHDHYFRYWSGTQSQLPTREMLQSASPEGVLNQDGVLAGFLYFEKIDDQLPTPGMTFKADIIDAASDEMLASLEIPIIVQGDQSTHAAVY